MNTAKAIDLSFIAACLIFLGLASLSVMPSLEVQIILLLAGSLTIGLPHGAMDYEVAKHLGLCGTILKKALFFGLYTLIALLNFGLWILSPLSGFILFLILSLIHFSEDWEDAYLKSKAIYWFKRFVFATAFISLPSLVSAQDLNIAFSFLISLDQASQVVKALNLLAVPLLVPTLFFVMWDLYTRAYRQGLVTLSFLLSGIFLPPILFLSLYFCILHGPRHTLELYDELNYKSFADLIRRNSVVIILTLVSLLGFFIFFDTGLESFKNIFSILIIFIACLTTPHVLLIAYMKWAKKA